MSDTEFPATSVKSTDILGHVRGDTRSLRVKRYDFRRPDKFSKEQIRTISIMHETFARLTRTSLSAQLRYLAELHVASVDQLTYEEFIRSIPNPTTIAIINMHPLKGAALLAAAGVGTIGIMDYDVVDITNLQRQIIHFSDDVGFKKTESAKQKLKNLNPDINIIIHVFNII